MSAPRFKFPESLGDTVAEWIVGNCVYGPGDVYGQTVELTAEEIAFLHDLYAIDRMTGRRLTDVGVYSRGKGTRKSELGAWITLAEVRGPVRAWLSDTGRPIAGPVNDPYAIVVATTEDQASATCYGALRAIVNASPALEDYFDLGLERILLRDKPGRIELLQTRNPGALDGARPTFQVGEETHLWIGPTLHEAWATLRRNLRKRSASQPWVFCPTTAYQPGEGSVLESLHEMTGRMATGRKTVSRVLFDHREAEQHWDLDDPEQLRAAITEASGDAFWRDTELIANDWTDPMVTPSAFRRYWLNSPVVTEDTWVAPQAWDACQSDEQLQPGDRVCLGFDGSLTDDATALVACRLTDGLLSVIGLWQPRGQDEPVDQAAVDATLRAAFDTFDVVRAYCDPPRWQDWISTWSADFPTLAEWWTGRPKAMGDALERFHTAVHTGQLVHDGDADLAAHVSNARRQDHRGYMAIRKENPWSARKIDAAMAAVLAYEARADAIADGALRVKSKRTFGFR